MIRAAVCWTAVLLAVPASAQPDLTVLSLDYFRTDRISGESRHEILPVAVFDGMAFRSLSERGDRSETDARREQLLVTYAEVHVLYRGRRVGTVDVSDRFLQNFSCSELTVGSGAYEPFEDLPASEITASARGSGEGRNFDYAIAAYIAVSGSIDEARLDGDALVANVTDPVELERYALDVAAIEPRANLLPLAVDETRAYRLDRYDAVVIVRYRRSAAKIQGPAGLEFESSLMTDIVIVRTGAGERAVHPLYRSMRGMDAMGQGEPTDRFMDAFEIEAGTAYLAFDRSGYESRSLRIFRLEPNGSATLVFENGLFGC